jgi:hypothetical protein
MQVSTSEERPRPSSAKQLALSLLAAIVITIATIAIVTAKIGPGLDSEEIHDQGGGDHTEQVDDDHSGPG